MCIMGNQQEITDVEVWVREKYGDDVLAVFKTKMIERRDLGVHDVLQLALENVYAQEVELSCEGLSELFQSEEFFVPHWESDGNLDDENG